MKSLMTSIAALGMVGCIALVTAGCGGGGLSKSEEAALQEQLEEEAAAWKAEEAKREEAERKLREAEDERRQAEEERQAQLEAARQAREEAERKAREAEEEAARRIEEAARQADDNVRAGALIGVLSADLTASAAMGVTHAPGASLTFSRPSALPAAGSAPSVPGTWQSRSYSGQRGTVGTDTVYLYTNIQAPGSKAFWKEHGERVTTITASEATVSGFGMPAKTLLDTDSTDRVTRSGTYDGYSGTFACETGCNIATEADTNDLTFTGTWTFTASQTARKSSSHAEQDSEFLYFGIWAFEPTNPADTTNPHTLNWAAGGDADDITAGNFAALTGEATFAGGAIGKYALAKATGRGARAAKTGTFTATATFTAVFGASPTISGRITDFKEGGDSLGSDWHVYLGGTLPAAATLAATGATGATSGAIDDDNITGGSWTATLHGSDNEDMSGVTGYTAAKYPRADVAGVAGWFRANAGTDAAIAGAFGAACTTGSMCAR